MKRTILSACFAILALGATACGKPFDVKTAPGFVPLEGQSAYEYRATTPEGAHPSGNFASAESLRSPTFSFARPRGTDFKYVGPRPG